MPMGSEPLFSMGAVLWTVAGLLVVLLLALCAWLAVRG